MSVFDFDYRQMLGYRTDTRAPYWCARAIYRPGEWPDLVADRQTTGGDAHGRGELLSKLETGVLSAFLAKARNSGEPGSGYGRIEHRARGVVVRGTPNGSCGYLYVGATVESAADPGLPIAGEEDGA
jgi:hypothetical protein